MAISCSILGFWAFAPDNPLVSPGDMRPVVKHISYLFCDEVQVVSQGLTFDGYLTSKSTLGFRTNEQVNQRTALAVENLSYNYFSFYFLQNSELDLISCATVYMVFYFIRGRDNFEAWKEYGDGCEGCFLSKRYINPTDCSNIYTGQEFQWTVMQEDEYFLVYSNPNGDNTWINVNFRINRVVYELDNALKYCSNQNKCEINLKNADDVVVVVSNDADLGEFSHSSLTTKCGPRIWAYLVIHGVPVLIIGITASLLIQRFCSSRERNSTPNERSPLLYSPAAPPDYQYVIQTPPKYDDIYRTCDPPSYSDVTNNLSAYTVNTSVQDDDRNTAVPDGHTNNADNNQLVLTDETTNSRRQSECSVDNDVTGVDVIR